MKRSLIIIAAIGGLAIAGFAVANMTSSGNATASATDAAAVEKTQVFAIENMTCASCPITVKTAMKKVDGVSSVDVDFEAKTATVVYDPAIATAEQIANASTNAGYPASPADA
jgi:periplasmic mercuric ion binding protein